MNFWGWVWKNKEITKIKIQIRPQNGQVKYNAQNINILIGFANLDIECLEFICYLNIEYWNLEIQQVLRFPNLSGIFYSYLPSIKGLYGSVIKYWNRPLIMQKGLVKDLENIPLFSE